MKGLPVAAIAAALFSCHGRPPPAPPTLSRCAAIRGAANAAFERVPNVSDWYDVYRVTDGVYALSEPRQWREVISYLVVGSKSALLFDSGLGMEPDRTLVVAVPGEEEPPLPYSSRSVSGTRALGRTRRSRPRDRSGCGS